MKLCKLPWGAEIFFAWPEASSNYEKESWKHIRCPKDGVAVDVGAHHGFYTTKLSMEAGEKGHVYAFEPEIRNYNILNGNIKLNKLCNVTTIQKALLNYDGEGTLFTYNGSARRNSGQHFIRGPEEVQPYWNNLSEPPPKPHYDTKISVSKLDTVLEQYSLDRLDIIKMDIEGAEKLVIDGAVETIKKFSPKIVFEVHFGQKHNVLLKELGYSIEHYISGLNFTGNPLVVYSK